MPGYASKAGLLGVGPVNDLFVADTTQRFPLGDVVEAYDAYFGWGRFIYGKAAAAQVVGELVYWDNAFVMTSLPSTAGQGFPFAVCRQKVAQDGYAWYQIEGNCPVWTANSVATGVATAVAATGKAGTLANGKQLLGVRVHQASTFTLTKVCETQNGTKIIKVNNVDGLFVGLTLSGTGVGAGTIASIDPSGLVITSSANSTATGVGITLTGTYTGYLLCGINNPVAQGQVA
jgi:hypothetical protein